MSESESESESGPAEEEKEEPGTLHCCCFCSFVLLHGLVERDTGEREHAPETDSLTGGKVSCEVMSGSNCYSTQVNKVVLTPTSSYVEEALKEKEKPKEEEREKPKDAAGLECKPRPLHKTCSLFMRNIAPNISRAEIISVSGDIGLGDRVG